MLRRLDSCFADWNVARAGEVRPTGMTTLVPGQSGMDGCQSSAMSGSEDYAGGRTAALRRTISVLISPNCFRVSASINAGPITGGTHMFGV